MESQELISHSHTGKEPLALHAARELVMAAKAWRPKETARPRSAGRVSGEDDTTAIERIVSSAYCSMEMPSATKCGSTPLNCPTSFARARRTANISTTRLNKRGDKGYPCLTPFLD